jgi:16S rRNA (uracil1498-N3)-methyltransferase
MHIPRVYLDAPLAVGIEVNLDGRAHHHLCNVLRLKPGARLVLFNGRGGEYTARLNRHARKASSAVIDAFVSVDRESTLHSELLQGIAKGARMDYILQKAVELGVGRVQPVLTRYAAAPLSNWRNRLLHWQGVIGAACEQSGRTRIPVLGFPNHVHECLTVEDAALGLVLDPQASRGLHDLAQAPQRIALLIGPEGGLCDDELQHAQAEGFIRVRMGPRTLRTETAATTAIAVVQALWGDLLGP